MHRAAARSVPSLRRHTDEGSLPAAVAGAWDMWWGQTRSRPAKRQANEIRPGNILELNGRLMVVYKSNHAQGTGRQIGNVQLELRDLLNRSKHPLRLRPSDAVDVVRLEERKFECMYLEGDAVHCMDPSTFDQVAVEASLFGTAAQYLTDGLEVSLHYHDGQPVSAAVPPTITAEVADAAPHMKGETATPSFKPATLVNGVKVMVPPFVQRGDHVVVDTASGEFLRRG